MNTLQCREWKIVCLLVCSACAGSLENAEDYQAVPVPRTPEAGRAGQNTAGWGGAKASAAMGGAGAAAVPSASGGAGAGGWSAQAGSPSNPGAGGSRAGAGGQSGEEDAGVADAGSTQTPTEPACDFRALMMAKCAGASCHGGPASATGLDLTSAMLAARVEGRDGNGACSDKLLVDPENPRESKLYLKVSGSTCGSQMPLGGQLDADEQACVLTWIEGL